MHILVIDDDAALAEMLRRTITRWGHRVELAATGKAATEIIGKTAFDLIFLDIFLPDAVGLELIHEFKAIQPDIRIITMTGYSTPDLERRIRAAGVMLFMAKPMSSEELKSILDHMAEKIGAGGPARRGNSNGNPIYITKTKGKECDS